MTGPAASGEDTGLHTGLRAPRTKWVWVLVVPFFWFATPTWGLLYVGLLFTGLGLVLRAWAAGTIRKDEVLTVTGPYAYTRNPLYIGNLFIGMGVTMAGGHWIWPTVFAVFYAPVYGMTLQAEERVLSGLFGDAYNEYRANVPSVLPRLTPWQPDGDERPGFRMERYQRNNEWEAALGAAAAFAILAGKAMWVG